MNNKPRGYYTTREHRPTRAELDSMQAAESANPRRITPMERDSDSRRSFVGSKRGEFFVSDKAEIIWAENGIFEEELRWILVPLKRKS